MPIPSRRRGESLRDFLERGHRALSDEYPDPRQRHAVLMRMVSKSGVVDSLVEGIRVEMEHTGNELVAASIALDHLREDPYYYVKLRALEGPIDTMTQSVVELGNKGDEMDKVDGVTKALEGIRVLARAVRKAAYEEGHVSHRADGDYQKRGGEWTKLPLRTRHGMAPTAAEGVKVSPGTVEEKEGVALKLLSQSLADPVKRDGMQMLPTPEQSARERKLDGAVKVYARLKGINTTAARAELTKKLSGGKPGATGRMKAAERNSLMRQLAVRGMKNISAPLGTSEFGRQKTELMTKILDASDDEIRGMAAKAGVSYKGRGAAPAGPAPFKYDPDSNLTGIAQALKAKDLSTVKTGLREAALEAGLDDPSAFVKEAMSMKNPEDAVFELADSMGVDVADLDEYFDPSRYKSKAKPVAPTTTKVTSAAKPGAAKAPAAKPKEYLGAEDLGPEDMSLIGTLDGAGQGEVEAFFKSNPKYARYDGPIPEGEDDDGNDYNARSSDGSLYWNDNYDSWNGDDDEED